ncbi:MULTISPECIES: hypothetical protein [Lactococcus]|jgi:hypothetical protein|uniref:Uncharacterized protein n=1 Tax=Lactococcus lactis subsp. lactis TaxID=1360 RepID=A0AAC9W958_LACLL|nr:MULTISPECIES: hypothetical protein [Lactococcus]ARE13490.1 hypothetical protein LLUC11_1157 [Lactococcus lactis subsp. lactis]ARE15900.1 hypothetical protein LLUC08_1158 [Lactococcus lactis subsp. lactis]MDT2904817.1 hypothetical protein [Lactococcus lactis]MDT2910592.1 hypothetical protein [Lactococcus lactis]MDT2931663.1 hypothetical protein [Lactococcus lactis]
MNKKLKKIAAKTNFSLAAVTTTVGYKMTALADVTTTSAVKTMQSNIKWGFGTAGIIVALLGLGWLFLSWDDGPAARRSPIFTLVGGVVLVGIGFAIAAAITAPPGA